VHFPEKYPVNGTAAGHTHSEVSDSPANRDAQHEEFVVLLNRAHRQLLAYLVSLLSNRHDAEDVLQRTSVTLWRKFDAFQQGTDFVAWASTVAFYEARNFQRVTRRSPLQFNEELMNLLAVERVADLEQTTARHEALGHCLQKLDSSGRQLVEAAYFEGADLSALAEEAGRARQTFYNKLNVIRRALADCVTRRLAQEGVV
jgi:RNA polymerase sigma-70 factor, ECF subfamily